MKVDGMGCPAALGVFEEICEVLHVPAMTKKEGYFSTDVQDIKIDTTGGKINPYPHPFPFWIKEYLKWEFLPILNPSCSKNLFLK